MVHQIVYKMSSISGKPSPFTKMKQAYWEARQSFIKSMGQREDGHIISSDHELDVRLELLQAADSYFNTLMRVIRNYSKANDYLVKTEENLGLYLIEHGTKDTTAAGKVMCMSGKAINKAARRHSQLKEYLVNLFNEVETFQFHATADALQTVGKMEKARKSYRSGLLWLKNESRDLDPDVVKKLRTFKKVQEHIKFLKVKFDGVKLESMQKIDLYLLSRTNLFSYALVPYSKSFKKTCKNSLLFMDYTLKNIPLCLTYKFVTVKELNQYSKLFQTAFQQQLYSERASKKQKNRSQKKVRPSSAESNAYPLPSHAGDFELSQKDRTVPLQPNATSADRLIDLKGIDQPTMEENSKRSPKYSDDLLSLNFEEFRPKFIVNGWFSKQSDAMNMQRSFAGSTSQGIPMMEKNDLDFWSLIQSYEQASKLLETDNPTIKNSDIISPQQCSSISNYKWSDILVQFDPFTDETSICNDKSEDLEAC